jgi:hypothetical protein
LEFIDDIYYLPKDFNITASIVVADRTLYTTRSTALTDVLLEGALASGNLHAFPKATVCAPETF